MKNPTRYKFGIHKANHCCSQILWHDKARTKATNQIRLGSPLYKVITLKLQGMRNSSLLNSYVEQKKKTQVNPSQLVQQLSPEHPFSASCINTYHLLWPKRWWQNKFDLGAVNRNARTGYFQYSTNIWTKLTMDQALIFVFSYPPSLNITRWALMWVKTINGKGKYFRLRMIIV